MIKVLLSEDTHSIRRALAAQLDQEPGVRVVAEVLNGNDLLATALRVRPHVAVVGVDLPGCDRLITVVEIGQRLPETRALILTGMSTPGNVRRALSTDVAGFLLKNASPARLADAVCRVAAGQRVVDRRLATLADGDAMCPLHPRQIEVLGLTAEGMDPIDIAAELFVSVGTVRGYLAAAIGELAARDRVDAIRIARQAGWL